METNSCDETLKDNGWILEVQEEQDQSFSNDDLGRKYEPKEAYVVATKWVIKNKFDEEDDLTIDKIHKVRIYIFSDGVCLDTSTSYKISWNWNSN